MLSGSFRMRTTEYVMKKFSSFHHTFALVCGLAAAAFSMSSCSSTLSPAKMADRLGSAEYTQVYSFNDQLAPKAREFFACGPLPERAHRALLQWLKESEVRDYTYARPQYYVELTTMNRHCRPISTVWALCTDERGNLTGVLAPRSKDPRTLPTVGNYKLYVCNSENKAALNEAIMTSLAPYDEFRASNRTAKGLRTISKPLPAAQIKLIEEQRKAALAKAQEARLAAEAARNGAAPTSGTENAAEEEASGSEDDATTSEGEDETSTEDAGTSDESGSAEESDSSF